MIEEILLRAWYHAVMIQTSSRRTALLLVVKFGDRPRAHALMGNIRL